MSITPKTSWPWVRTLLHSIYDQPDTAAVEDQFTRVVDTLSEKLPVVAEYLENAPEDILAFRHSPQHGDWAEGRRYLGLDVLAKSQAIDELIKRGGDPT